MNQLDSDDYPVLIAHQDPVIRLGLSAALSQSGIRNTVVSRRPGDVDVEPLAGLSPVIVTDYAHAMTLRRLQQQSRRASNVLVVSSRDGEHEIRSAIEAGVKGYLLAGFELEEFIEGVQKVAQGIRYLCSTAAHRMVDSMTHEALTTREMEVLRCLLAGYVNKQICDEMHIALGTVKAHVKSIFGKFGVATRTQVVCIATERGFVASEPRSRGNGSMRRSPSRGPDQNPTTFSTP